MQYIFSTATKFKKKCWKKYSRKVVCRVVWCRVGKRTIGEDGLAWGVGGCQEDLCQAQEQEKEPEKRQGQEEEQKQEDNKKQEHNQEHE